MVQNPSTDPKSMTGSARALERKRAILEAAGRAFRARGFHDTSMRDIAAETGMTVGNLYYYFENKQALLAFCQHETLDRLIALVDEAKPEDGNVAARLRRIIVGHIVCLHDSLPGAIAHLSLDPLPEADRQRCIERRDHYEAALRELVRQGIGNGEFAVVDERVAVWTILGALNGTTLWFRSEGPHSARALGERMADQLVRGLLPHSTDPTIHSAPASTPTGATSGAANSNRPPIRRFP